MTIPKFSVVIPCYNRADRIMPTLESVMRQTWQDFECIVVDDGSKDGEALKAVVEGLNSPKFRYVRRENGGGSAARNTGILEARGEYVALLDSDDQFLPEKLQVCADTLAGVTDERVMCYSQLMVDRGVGKTWIKPPEGLKPGERVDEYIMCGAGWVQTSTMVLSAGLAKTVLFNEALPSSQDTDFAIRCATAGARYIFIQQPLVIMEDRYDPTRVSKQKNFRPLLNWIETMRGVHISDRSYWAYRGWQCARIASFTNRPLAVWIYLQSIVHRPYSLKTSLQIAAQILIPQTLYQRMSSWIVNVFGKRA
ncbi:glycosyltransferase family 2 protein [Rhizobiaceae bacterium BDR2-2]|uniref:Glycosyltransferase family 2 protein n=1 Tax=Ectorhizobium quercum TaxID=2965071 RepID=A0AAE3MZF1_9HYPH|nr:glycosyltransferase family 2 protein [Ectorhizobium quercum]MCX8998133.1 glycosyltransferase family 2 protein [Ectorhizobium quercum]